jgi:hypothetical protein
MLDVGVMARRGWIRCGRIFIGFYLVRRRSRIVCGKSIRWYNDHDIMDVIGVGEMFYTQIY